MAQNELSEKSCVLTKLARSRSATGADNQNTGHGPATSDDQLFT